MNYKLVYFLLCFVPQVVLAQIPKNPNLTDDDGRRQGTWTISYDTDWKITEVDDSVAFYRLISFEDDVPQGLVRDYYLSGQIQWQGNLLQDRPRDVCEGEVTFFRIDGSKDKTRIYKHGEMVSETRYNLDGSDIKASWEDINVKLTEAFQSANYEVALSLAEVAVHQCVLQYGKQHDYYMTSLYNQARVLEILGDVDLAISLNEEALRRCENRYGDHQVDCVSYLTFQSQLFSDVGRLDEALDIALESLSIIKTNLGEEDLSYGSQLNDLAGIHFDMKRYDSTLFYYEESIAHTKRVLGIQDPRYLTGLNNLASFHQFMGEHESAILLYGEVLSIQLDSPNTTESQYATCLLNLAYSHEDAGNILSSIDYYTELVNFHRSYRGVFYSEYSIGLMNLGRLLMSTGQYDKSLEVYTEFLSNCEEFNGVDHLDYGLGLNQLSIVYARMGEYEKALAFAVQSMEHGKEALGIDHPQYGSRVNNLASIYLELGDYQSAHKMYLESLDIIEARYGRGHADCGRTLMNIASIYQSCADPEGALPFLSEAMEILGNSLGEDHQDYQIGINNLARLNHELGNLQEAEGLYFKILSSMENHSGIEHPDYGVALSNLSLLCRDQGKVDLAKDYSLRSLENIKRNFGEDSFRFAQGLLILASIWEELEKIQEAFDCHSRSSMILRSKMKEVKAFTSESQQILYSASVQTHFDSFKRFAQNYSAEIPEIAGVLYDNELLLKAQTLANSGTVHKSASNMSAEERPLFDELTFLRNEVYKMEMTSNPIFRNKIDGLRAQAEEIEKRLSQSSSEYRKAHDSKSTTWLEVQNALDENQVAIEFLCVDYFSNNMKDSTIYAALIVTQSWSQPHMISLGNEKDLELIFSNALSTSKGISGLYTSRGIERTGQNKATEMKGHALYDLIWAPIQEYVADSREIVFAPAGLLNKVSFDALATASGTLGFDKELRRVTSTRTIISEPVQPEKETTAIYSGITYDYDARGRNTFYFDPEDHPNGVEVSVSPDEVVLFWSSLPGAEKEGEAISSKFDPDKCSLLQELDATEESFKSLNGSSPHVVHIASHAFFFPKEEEDLDSTEEEIAFERSKDPLLRSGIILAGGSYAWKYGSNPHEEEDGILTSYEISQLDLSNTDLVVLSACETGLGEVQGSEGVFGLQRAFKMAGVDYIIMSLWKVPDEPTREFMELFYDNWLGGEPIRDAFRNTQRTMSEKYDPYEWAAFVLVE